MKTPVIRSGSAHEDTGDEELPGEGRIKTAKLRRRSHWKKIGGRTVAGLGWFVAVAMVLACGLRYFSIERWSFEVAIAAALPWLLAPSVVLVSLALWKRRWWLAGVAAICLVSGSVWELPVMWPVSSAAAAAPTGRFLLFDANVSQSNRNLSGIAGEIRTDRPNLIALEELTKPALRSLRASGALLPYHWGLVHAAQRGPGGVGVWSDYPLTGVSAWKLSWGQFEISGWINPPEGSPTRFDVVHVYAPVGANQPGRWRMQLAQLQTYLAKEPRPLLVAGDLNATNDTTPFRKLLDLRLSDAAVLAGKGWQMTWPRNQAWVIPYLRIDHVLLSSTLTVTSYRLGTGRGSDHRPLVVGIAFRK